MADRVRIHDVARAAGVSVTTVSHALSGRGKVSAATRDRVRRFATELGYAPNRVASALRLRRTGILGFVSDEVATTAFAGDIVLGAQEAAAARGMTLMLVNSDRDPGGGRRQVDALLAQQVDGLLWATMYHRAVEAPPVPDSTPLVLVNAVAPGSGLPAVVPDEEGLAVTATRLLIDAGHRSIAHVTIAEDRLGAAGRIAGYRSAMLAAGLRPHVVHGPAGPSTATTGRAAFARAMTERPGTTAVFCFNDPMAMGVYQGAADLGVRVPDDLSVVGVDDLEIIAAHLRPALTTLALPHAAMGRWAVDELVRRVEGEDPGPSTHPVRLACPLVTRASVAPPPS